MKIPVELDEINLGSNSYLGCGNCSRTLFVVDAERSGYKMPDLSKPIKLDGVTELQWETYFKLETENEGELV